MDEGDFMNIKNVNVIVLAYIGDSVYEVYIRNKLIELGISKVDELQREAVKYVSAKGQAMILREMLNNNILSDEEVDVVKRGRNNKRGNHPKNTDIVTYKMSTGFEALIGYLYLSSNYERLEEILDYIEVK
jgi:ribonuclease-3 family protein